MLKVYICDDQEIIRKKITQIIENRIMMEDLDMSVIMDTGNPYEVLEACEKSQNTGVYFLDVDLGYDINGIQLAERIRQYDPRGFIIFITTHGEMSHLTFKYKVEALDYIVKDDIEDLKGRIHQCLENVIQKYSLIQTVNQKNYCIKFPTRQVIIPYEKILFFETSSNVHKVILYATDRQIEFYGQLTDIEEQLDERFIRCHRSFLVNKDNISEFDKVNREIVMKNSQRCCYSSRFSRMIKTVFAVG